MSRTAAREYTSYSSTSGYYEQRMPPLSAQGLMADRNSRIIRGNSYDYDDDYYMPPSRKATRRNKVYRKKVSSERYEPNRRYRPRNPYISLKEKSVILSLVLLVGVILFSAITFSAYSADLQNGINKTNANSAVVQKDIDTLNVQIEEGKTISTLERRAKEEAGMKYPSTKEIVYLDDVAAASEETVAEENGD